MRAVAPGEVTQHVHPGGLLISWDTQEHSLSGGVPITNLAGLSFLIWEVGRSALCKVVRRCEKPRSPGSQLPLADEWR